MGKYEKRYIRNIVHNIGKAQGKESSGRAMSLKTLLGSS